MTEKYRSLKSAAKALCDAFAAKSPPDELLSYFSSSPVAFEHGHPSLAPFLGREFSGNDGVLEYFNMLGDKLTYRDMSFSDYVVDEVELKVCVKGRAKFQWKETRIWWEEVFTYTLDMAEDEGNEGGFKVQRYSVWADSGALYLAIQGRSLES